MRETNVLVAVRLAVIGDVTPFAAPLTIGGDLPLGAVAEELVTGVGVSVFWSLKQSKADKG